MRRGGGRREKVRKDTKMQKEERKQTFNATRGNQRSRGPDTSVTVHRFESMRKHLSSARAPLSWYPHLVASQTSKKLDRCQDLFLIQ